VLGVFRARKKRLFVPAAGAVARQHRHPVPHLFLAAGAMFATVLMFQFLHPAAAGMIGSPFG